MQFASELPAGRVLTINERGERATIDAQRVAGTEATEKHGGACHSVDYGHVIKNQHASTQLFAGPYLVQICSRYPQILGGSKPL